MTEYKIQLISGRILGPLKIDRIRKLIKKRKITGKELAKEHPDGDWKDINKIAEIAELLLLHLQGKLISEADTDKKLIKIIQQEDVFAPTVKLDKQTAALPGAEKYARELGITENEKQDDRTIAANDLDDDQEQKTEVFAEEHSLKIEKAIRPIEHNELNNVQAKLSEQETIVFEQKPATKSKYRSPFRKQLFGTVLAVLLGVLAYDLFIKTETEPQSAVSRGPIRPKLPVFLEIKADPEQSKQLLNIGISDYLADNVMGYKRSAKQFFLAATLDNSNVKAFALLASSYLNLIDSSNKDENYFSVISKLIDMSKAKQMDLPEAVIADVEFFIIVNRADAAKKRIIDYSKTHKIDNEMYYYLSEAFFAKNDYSNAAKYVSAIPDNKVFSPKVFYLRGRIAEKFGMPDEALSQYKKAIKLNKYHAKSYIKIADIYNQKGELSKVASILEYLMVNPQIMSLVDLAKVYYLKGRLGELKQDYIGAQQNIQKAVNLDRNNHDYLLELFTLKARAGGNVSQQRGEARMYYFLGEGEAKLKEGKYQEALLAFHRARQEDSESPLPLVKIGDMFVYLNKLGDARRNYKAAAEKAPDDIDIWSKYIKTLIGSYEWEVAEKAMKRFRKMSSAKSSIDKLAGDMYAKQGLYPQAMIYYRKAMARETIASDVYVAYANALAAVNSCDYAPFFYALARRFDPLSMEAVIGTAKCVAKTESIQRAIEMLEDELQQLGGSRIELIAEIAEFQIQKGDWTQAENTIDQAISLNPEYARPWWLKARLFLNKADIDKNALNEALSAYRAYSDRNPSDPSGYLEVFKVLLRQGKLNEAGKELDKVYVLYPKYPSLHLHRGNLYLVNGNTDLAIQEYEKELVNHPTNVNALVALGKVIMDKGEPDKALVHLSRAMQLSPMAPEPKHFAGYANLLLKNYSAAIALFKAALEQDKGNPLIYKRLGWAYVAIGDKKSAAQAFKTYLQMDPEAKDRKEIEGYL